MTPNLGQDLAAAEYELGGGHVCSSCAVPCLCKLKWGISSLAFPAWSYSTLWALTFPVLWALCLQKLARESRVRAAYAPSHTCNSLWDARKLELLHLGNFLVVLGSCSISFNAGFCNCTCAPLWSRLGHLFWIAVPSSLVGALTGFGGAVTETWSVT